MGSGRIWIAIGIMAAVAAACGGRPPAEPVPEDAALEETEVSEAPAPPAYTGPSLWDLAIQTPLADGAVEFETIHLPMVLWDHYDAQFTNIAVTTSAAAVDAALMEWAPPPGEVPGNAWECAAALAEAFAAKDVERFLALVAAEEGAAPRDDLRALFEIMAELFESRTAVRVRFAMASGDLWMLAMRFAHAEGDDDDVITRLMPFAPRNEGAGWHFAPDFMRDVRLAMLAATLFVHFDDPAGPVPLLEPGQAERAHRFAIAPMLGGEDALHPMYIAFDGGAPGQAYGEGEARAHALAEIWEALREVEAFEIGDPAWEHFLGLLTPLSAESALETLEEHGAESMREWRDSRPDRDGMRFVIDAAPLWIVFAERADGQLEYTMLRGDAEEGVRITNHGHEDYFPGFLGEPSFVEPLIALINAEDAPAPEEAPSAAPGGGGLFGGGGGGSGGGGGRGPGPGAPVSRP